MTPCATESTVVLLIVAAALCGAFIGYMFARTRRTPGPHHDEHEDFPGC